MANLFKLIYNIKFIFILLNIIILLSAAPTLIPKNLTDSTINIIDNENISLTTIAANPNEISKLIAPTATELPQFNRNNLTKPIQLQKTKKLTKNLNTKKLKEKNLKYSISSNTGKQQINNNLIKNQIEGLTTNTLLTTEIELLPISEGKLFNENNNNNNNNNSTEKNEILKTTILPLSTIFTTITPITNNNTNISNLSKLDKSEVTNDDKNDQTTFIPVQIKSRNEKQINVEFSTTFPTTTISSTSTIKNSELIISTTIIVPTKDNEKKILQDDEMEISTPLTMNINIHQGHNDKKDDKILTNNNSIVSIENVKNDFVSSTVNGNEEIISTTLTSLQFETTQQPSQSLFTSSDLTVTPSQIDLSQKEISVSENHKDNVTSILEKNNNKMITENVNLNNTKENINLDSAVQKKIINLNSEMSTESTTTSMYADDITNHPNLIQNFTITNNTNQIKNNSGMVNLMGHDGVKLTKKKQLIEKHFQQDDEFMKQSLTKINIHNDSTNTNKGENIKNIKIGSNNKLKVTQNSFSPIIIKDEIQQISTTDINNDKNIENIMEISTTTTEGNNIEFTTEDKLDTTILLDIDLIPKITNEIELITEIPTSTENDFIKHKNFEKSLISKMEWIPIENIDHTLMNINDYQTTTKIDKLLDDSFEQTTTTTIFPFQLTTLSELNGYNINNNNVKTDLLTNTEFIPITKFKTELDPKSLEIELIDTQAAALSIDKNNIKSVPEFFEISSSSSSSSKQHQNDEKESESSPIEIQINVSEGFGNETENLEFSFRQPQQQQQQQQQRLKQKHIGHLPPPGFQEIGEITIQRTPDLNTLQSIPLIDDDFKQNNNDNNNNIKSNDNDEILQVEITAIDNSTTKINEKQLLLDTFNDTPKFTVHNEQNGELRENDDFFIPDLKMEPIEDNNNSGLNKNLENLDRDSIDQDSDTIFYISNTEVKVAESLPQITNLSINNQQDINHIRNNNNKNLNNTQDSNRSKLESQFFPTIYEDDVIIDTITNNNQSKLNKFDNHKINYHHNNQQQQEEEIILSPIKKFLEPIKIINNNNNNNNNNEEIILNSIEKPLYKSAAAVAAAAAPDVSYVGETYIEIEESTQIPKNNNKFNNKNLIKIKKNKINNNNNKDNDFPVIIMDADMNSSGALLSDVIIQPAMIPEMSIGVPVIGELPPQIELKEIDFVPTLNNNVKDINNNNNNNNHEQRLIDNSNSGSIQYGADLIADESELNDNPNRYIFESGYPFTDEKINHVGRIQNNDDIDIIDRDNDNDQDNDDIMATSQQIIMHAVDNLQRDQLIADLPLSDSWEGYKEIPIKRNNNNNNNKLINNIVGENSTIILNNSTIISNSTSVNGTELLGNATAFSVLEDNDVTDFNLADIQTLIIACLATLIPLILSLLTAFGLRYLWIKYRRDHDEGSGLVGDSSTDPLAAKSVAISQDELQTTESGYTLNRSNDTLESNTDITGRTSGGVGTIIDGVIVNSVGHDGISQSNNNNNNINNNNNGLRDIITISTNQQNGGGVGNGNNTSIINNKNLSNHCGANGSVTTMTLKNNHLIVETEERNDISRDARETKMHYTSSEKDGVFVVEVARGADSTGAPGSPHKDLTNHQKSYSIDIDNIEQQKQSIQQQSQDECNHEEVQIHQPPTSSSDTDILLDINESNNNESPFNNDKYNKCNNLGNSNTGLSQSDLSSSSDDSNKAYSYGKQELYTIPINSYSPSSQQPKIISPLQQCIANGIDDNNKKIIEIENNNNDIKSNKNNIETKPFITAALLKQDTLNDFNDKENDEKINNCNENNCNGRRIDNNIIESKIIKSNDNDENSIIKNINDTKDNNHHHQIDDDENRMNDKKISDLNQDIIQNKEIIIIDNYENGNINGNIKENDNINEISDIIIDNNCVNGENGFDSIISLPEPPSTEEIKQMNDIILMENNQLDSLPPPPPPECQQQIGSTVTVPIIINTNGNSFNNNISPIPESIIEDDKSLMDDENCYNDDDDKIILTTTSKEEEQQQLHSINELQNGIVGNSGGGGTNTVVVKPLTVTGSS